MENVWIPCLVAPSGISVSDSQFEEKKTLFSYRKKKRGKRKRRKHFPALNHLMSECKAISPQSASISSKNVMNALCL
jgi:hypothetical protein